MGAPDIGDTGFGHAEEPHLAGLDEFADDAGYILDRDLTVDAMLV
jgi:hypothetical protein